MEITLYEDPCCTWCWAFQPVTSALAFEFGHILKIRRVMGGLRDRPTADVGFLMRHWKKAEAVFGMPFNCRIWKRHLLRTTFVACRAVKAAAIVDEAASCRLLRRLREALYVEEIPIDDNENVLALAGEVGLDRETLYENIASGRAEALFARDRAEASRYGFGFPTAVMRNAYQDAPVILQGAVPYSDVLSALSSSGLSPKERRRFKDSREDWARVFSIHRRLTFAEIQLVTMTEETRLRSRLAGLGIRQSGPFYELGENTASAAYPWEEENSPGVEKKTEPTHRGLDGAAASPRQRRTRSPSTLRHPDTKAQETAAYRKKASQGQESR